MFGAGEIELSPGSQKQSSLDAILDRAVGYDVRSYADYAAARSVLTADKPVVLPGLGWNIAESNLYSYGGEYLFKNALGPQYLVGDRAAPTAAPDPIMWIEKYSTVDRNVYPHLWDQVLYAAIKKLGGAAYASPITGYVRHEAGTGQMIGVHGRGEARHVNAQVWGGWSYASTGGAANTDGALAIIAHEFNLNNQGPDAGWMAVAGVGASRGLICVTQDNSNPVTQMIVIGKGSGAPNGYIWTGMVFRGDSFVVPTEAATEVGNGEAVRFEGDVSGQGPGGIRFRTGHFRYGISFQEASITNNCAILLADSQRISVGTGPASSWYIELNRTNSYVNFQNMFLRMGGVQVVRDRRTGWAADTGTVKRTANATYSGTAEAIYTQATIQALMDKVRDNSQTIKALKDDFISHGLIGA